MSAKIERFFKKHSFAPEDIKYITRENSKTAIHLLDGRVIHTYNTVKEFKETLSELDFLHPNKGVLAAASQITAVHDGAYEMADGRIFKYRVHNSERHDKRLLMLGRKMEQEQSVAQALSPENIPNRFSILDNYPLPSCVIEAEFNEYGLSTNFVFRYCNKAMEEFEGLTKDQILDRSIFDVFDVDKQRLAVYTDVAVNGSLRVTKNTKPNFAHNKVVCYQPAEGFCMCMMLPLDIDE